MVSLGLLVVVVKVMPTEQSSWYVLYWQSSLSDQVIKHSLGFILVANFSCHYFSFSKEVEQWQLQVASRLQVDTILHILFIICSIHFYKFYDTRSLGLNVICICTFWSNQVDLFICLALIVVLWNTVTEVVYITFILIKFENFPCQLIMLSDIYMFEKNKFKFELLCSEPIIKIYFKNNCVWIIFVWYENYT